MPIFSLMTELSPAALAIRDAAEKQTDLDFRYAPAIAAAVLEAAADQVATPEEERLFIEKRPWDAELGSAVNIRQQLLAIAAELKAHD